MLLPWYLWNLRVFGEVISTSGQLKFRNPRIWGALPNDWDGLADSLVSLSYVLVAPLLKALSLLTQSPIARSRLHFWFAIPLLVALLWIAALGLRAWQRAGRPYHLDRLFLVVYLFLHGAFYGWLWRVYGSWYSMPVVAATVILVAIAINAVLSTGSPVERRGIWFPTGLFAVTSLVLFVLMFFRVPGEAKGPEAQWVRVFDQLERQLPDRSVVVGAWDAGVAGYVALRYPNITVTNLDGLVNNEVQRAVQEERYLQYLVETVDVFVQDRRRAGMYLSAEEVELLENYGR